MAVAREADEAQPRDLAGRDRTDGAGVLAPGHVVDLVVLDRDPFTGPVSEIGATRVVSTWVGGTRVHG